MRKRILVSGIVLALVLAMVPMAAMADTDTGTTQGSVALSNAGPTIGTPTMDALVPNTIITLTVPVTDANTLNDITEVWAVLAFDGSDSESGLDSKVQGDTAVCTLAIVKWTPSGGFALEGPVSTNWAVSGTAPSLGNASGDFVFSITISQVASYAQGGSGNDGWDVYIKVTDSGSAIDEDGPKSTQGEVPKTLVDKAMAAYGSVAVSTTTISFGTLVPNDSQQPITTPGAGYYTTTTIANTQYALQIHSVDWASTDPYTLTLDVDGNPGADSFSLEADDDTNVTDAQFVTKAAATVTGHGTDGPSAAEAGDDVNMSLWITLGPSIEHAVTYSGDITMTVVY